jgi:hypothetical protein
MVGGKALGPGCCQVLVNEVLDGKALLIRPFGTMNTMADALGHSIAWIRAKVIPLVLIISTACISQTAMKYKTFLL